MADPRQESRWGWSRCASVSAREHRKRDSHGGATAGTTFFRRHRWKILLLAFVAAVAAVASAWTALTLTFSYSDGDRIGYVQKFSHKGWICRTWEGELAMTPVPGAAPQ